MLHGIILLFMIGFCIKLINDGIAGVISQAITAKQRADADAKAADEARQLAAANEERRVERLRVMEQWVPD